jgi:hypothetical protein
MDANGLVFTLQPFLFDWSNMTCSSSLEVDRQIISSYRTGVAELTVEREPSGTGRLLGQGRTFSFVSS